jgi:hypothetical protein
MATFNYSYTVPKKSSREPREWLRFHEFSPDFNPECSAALTLREANLILRLILEELGKFCSHENCRKEITEGTQKRIEESKRFDPMRLLNCMHIETTNKLGKGKMGYKCVFIVLPHCVKRFLDDIDFTVA